MSVLAPHAHPRPPLTIGVMGAANGELDPQVIARSLALGAAIARAGCVLINGACPGYPFHAARAAKQAGGMVVGISPGLSLDEHVHKYGSPTEGHDVIVYTGSGLMGREVTNIRSSDMVVIVGGRSGTLGEFAIAFDEGKLIGVLEGSGGITDALPEIVEICHKATGAHVLYDADPEALVARLLDYYQAHHRHHASCFAEADGAPAAIQEAS